MLVYVYNSLAPGAPPDGSPDGPPGFPAGAMTKALPAGVLRHYICQLQGPSRGWGWVHLAPRGWGWSCTSHRGTSIKILSN